MLALMLENQPDSPFANLRRITGRMSSHNSSPFSQDGASGKAGAVHFREEAGNRVNAFSVSPTAKVSVSYRGVPSHFTLNGPPRCHRESRPTRMDSSSSDIWLIGFSGFCRFSTIRPSTFAWPMVAWIMALWLLSSLAIV